MRKVICILSDALRSDYIRRHELHFLKESIDNNGCFYVEKIIPSTGFCEIIEYVTARKAIEHNLLTQLTARTDWHRLERGIYLNIIDIISRVMPLYRVPIIKRLHSLITDHLLKYSAVSEDMINLRYNTPLYLLQFFEPTEAKYEYDSYEFGGKDNLFVWMKEKGISYDMDDFVRHNKIKGTDNDRLLRLKEKIHTRRLKDFTLLYLGYGELAHFYGTGSIKFKKVLKSYSEKLSEIYDLLRKKYDDSQLIILGDHGMIDVKRYINVKDIIKKIMRDMKYKCSTDYIYFIDSTIVRIWLKNFDTIRKVEDRLIESMGKYIENDNGTREYLNNFKPRFGEIILLLKPGNVFFSDFFNLKKIKGMHGYLSSYNEQAGTMISIGKNVEKKYVRSMELSDVRNYLQGLYGGA